MKQLVFLFVGLTTFLTGCLGTSPEEQARLDAEQICPDRGGTPEHCPGSPCLACHGDNSVGEQFVLAGTIYANPGDDTGLAGAVVTFQDADGETYGGATNSAGNFMFELTNNPSAVGAYESGRVLVTRPPRFPIASITVQDRSDPANPMLTMASPIHRDGSCATCHIFDATTTSASSPGRVYALQPMVP